MEFKTDAVLDLRGNAIFNASVRVLSEDRTLATVFDSSGVQVNNPVATDSTGEFSVAVPNGKYFFEISFAGRVYETRGPISFFDPMDGGAAAVVFQQVGTGAVQRTAQDKLRESVSVKDFGAIGDGLFNNLQAFTDAYNAVQPGGRILVPEGTFAGVSGTLIGSKFVIWETEGQPVGGGIWNLPGSIEQGFSTRKICAIQQTQPDGDNKFSFNRTANHNGGTPGFVCANTYTYSSIGKDNKNFEWNGVFVLDNYADVGENCAVYAQGNKRGTGPTWAAALESIDHTNTSNPTSGLIGLEVAMRANGSDDNKNRVGFDLVADRFIKTAGAFSHLSYGFRVQNNADSNSLVKIAYGVIANNVQVGFDTSEATIQTAAFRMATGQAIAFDAAAQQQVKYDGTGINYTSAGVSKVRLNADGSILLGGAMKINPIFNTGTQTPTVGANKPGTAGGAPATWVSVAINGTQYWMPLWGN